MQPSQHFKTKLKNKNKSSLAYLQIFANSEIPKTFPYISQPTLINVVIVFAPLVSKLNPTPLSKKKKQKQ